MQPVVRIRQDALATMTRHVGREPLLESCGLLAGRDAEITRAFPATNVAPEKATSYEIAPQELFHLMREMRSAGLRWMGIYHSHPNGRGEPSPRDIARAYYPDLAYFILLPSSVPPSGPPPASAVRVFSIRDGLARELRIEPVCGE